MNVYGMDSKGTVLCIKMALEKLIAENPKRKREDIAVIMTRPLFERLNLEIFGSPVKHDAKVYLCESEVRVMEGTGEEWYITAAHGFEVYPRFEEGKVVMIPKIEMEAQP